MERIKKSFQLIKISKTIKSSARNRGFYGELNQTENGFLSLRDYLQRAKTNKKKRVESIDADACEGGCQIDSRCSSNGLF